MVGRSRAAVPLYFYKPFTTFAMLKRLRQILRLRFVLIPAAAVVPFMCYEGPGNDTDTVKAIRKTGDQEQLELLSLRAKEYSSNKSIEEARNEPLRKG
ncbi:MAG: hypothetical protein MZV70_67080 [Desulfobacterales bacterium]|nr:hypothetical protein [Desulfobacterales bacterium]